MSEFIVVQLDDEMFEYCRTCGIFQKNNILLMKENNILLMKVNTLLMQENTVESPNYSACWPVSLRRRRVMRTHEDENKRAWELVRKRMLEAEDDDIAQEHNARFWLESAKMQVYSTLCSVNGEGAEHNYDITSSISQPCANPLIEKKNARDFLHKLKIKYREALFDEEVNCESISHKLERMAHLLVDANSPPGVHHANPKLVAICAIAGARKLYKVKPILPEILREDILVKDGISVVTLSCVMKEMIVTLKNQASNSKRKSSQSASM